MYLASEAAALDRAQLIRAMAGREIGQEFPARIHTDAREPAAPVLDVRSLSAPPRFSDLW